MDDNLMVFYPLLMLLLAGTNEVLLASTPEDLPMFRRLLGSGKQWGIKFSYAEQATPGGLADAFIVGKDFIQSEPVALILGDNIFYGGGLGKILQSAAEREDGATIFAYTVRDPEGYSLLAFVSSGIAYSIDEKPSKPLSNFAVPGIYFYDSNVTEYAINLNPSPRCEIRITDINRLDLSKKKFVC